MSGSDQRGALTRTRGVALAAAGLLLLVVLALTLTPAPGPVSVVDFWCFACGELGALDVVANVALFAPLGVALGVALQRRWLAIAICVVTTLAIELLQVGVVTGRDASLNDLVSNSVGGWVGVELARSARSLLRPAPRTARRLATTWSAIFVAVCAATSWGLRPAFVPRSLWVQWLPPRAGYEPFSGELLAFDVDGIDLPLGFPSSTLNVDRHLMRDQWVGTATVDRAGLRPRRSVIVRISEEYTQPFALEQNGWDLTCQQKTRSAELRFRSPRIALRDGFRLASGTTPDTVRASCGRRGPALVAAVRAGRRARETSVRLSPSLGWTLVSPFDVAVAGAWLVVSALWIAVLAFPLGYWGAAVRGDGGGDEDESRGVVGVVPAAAVVLGLVVAPTMAGTSSGTWWEWLAVALAIVGGAAVQRLVSRR